MAIKSVKGVNDEKKDIMFIRVFDDAIFGNGNWRC
jgi:hypothetical protein